MPLLPTTTRYRPGQRATEPKAGDVLLVHDRRALSRLCQWGQRRKYPAQDAYWNHTGMLVNPAQLVEATAAGVHRTELATYDGADYLLVRNPQPATARDEAAKWITAQIGDPYGFLDLLYVSANLLWGWKLVIPCGYAWTCSALVASALYECEIDLHSDPDLVCPAEIAAYFNVRSAT